MKSNPEQVVPPMPQGVILNAYPDSVGRRLSDFIQILRKPEFESVFSMFYILPTIFNSDLDRGFSVIDYNLNQELVTPQDLADLKTLGLDLKLDIVLNHLSVASPQFKDLLAKGEESVYKDFFLDWNAFWEEHGEMGSDGIVIPEAAYLKQLFMRKPGFPVLKLSFPDGKEKVYWNTFYQKITHTPIEVADLEGLELTPAQAESIVKIVNVALEQEEGISSIALGLSAELTTEVEKIVRQKATYLGQMDVNAASPLVWEFYEDTLAKLSAYGCRLLRLDAFAYLHKEVGQSNFFNSPGTWVYLERIREIANRNQMAILPEIHAEYGAHLHTAIAAKGHALYDFFLPGLLLHTLEESDHSALVDWVNEIQEKAYKTVNMLGCHDGIPVLDLNGKQHESAYKPGLLSADQIDAIMTKVLERGGVMKNIYDADGKKLSYYQINATFFSALGEDESKMLLARAIQVFMPGTPQVWYLDLFMGTNDYAAVKRAGSGGHKEINRSNLSSDQVDELLQSRGVQQQLALLKLRNTHSAFQGALNIQPTPKHQLRWEWKNADSFATLEADLMTTHFKVRFGDNVTVEVLTV